LSHLHVPYSTICSAASASSAMPFSSVLHILACRVPGCEGWIHVQICYMEQICFLEASSYFLLRCLCCLLLSACLLLFCYMPPVHVPYCMSLLPSNTLLEVVLCLQPASVLCHFPTFFFMCSVPAFCYSCYAAELPLPLLLDFVLLHLLYTTEYLERCSYTTCAYFLR
jgi:hypothetical protein